MQLIDFIQVIDKPIKSSTNESLLKFAESREFKTGGVLKKGSGDSVEDKKVRDTEIYSPNQLSDSQTEVHWANFLNTMFIKSKNEYCRRLNIRNFPYAGTVDIGFLKYGKGGHYKIHVDDAPEIPRTLSMIYLINDNYKGGELSIYTPEYELMYTLPVKANQVIIWPSSFMFPHGVKPVTEGTRYSIVSWIR